MRWPAAHILLSALPCRALQIDKCFGFDTAVEESQRALLAAKVEASSACDGVGLVRLMGRQSGYIAMQASMASGETAHWVAGEALQGSAHPSNQRPQSSAASRAAGRASHDDMPLVSADASMHASAAASRGHVKDVHCRSGP